MQESSSVRPSVDLSTAFGVACRDGDVALVGETIASGKDFGWDTSAGAFVKLAVRTNSAELVSLLLEYADSPSRDLSKWVALGIKEAIMYGRDSALSVLLAKDAGKTPTGDLLRMSVMQGNGFASANALRRSDAPVFLDGQMMLDAVVANLADVVRACVESGVPIDYRENEALYLAFTRGREAMTSMLFGLGADPGARGGSFIRLLLDDDALAKNYSLLGNKETMIAMFASAEERRSLTARMSVAESERKKTSSI